MQAKLKTYLLFINCFYTLVLQKNCIIIITSKLYFISIATAITFYEIWSEPLNNEHTYSMKSGMDGTCMQIVFCKML